ncbi:MAG: TonB-dependent receptor [Bacteriovoracia bacterium]
MKLIFLSFLFLITNVFAVDTSLEDVEVVHHETQGLVDFVPSVTKLQGHELRKRRDTSVGDMLRNEAGVESTYFGPNASRPVIRGLDGDRIRVLQNGLGTLDASSQSVDHAIPVDTLTIDQIEIVRGPMSLLYGASAVGGVVNIVTNRIHYEYEDGFFSKMLVQGETVNNGLSTSAHLNYGVNKWMLHADGSTRNLGDVEVPGQSGDKLENSFNKQDNVAGAVSRIFDRGYLGGSFNHFHNQYGVVFEENVSIDMTQNRGELHGEYRPESGTIRKWKIKSAQSNYFHKELEGDEVGTTFRNEGNETRIEGHNKSSRWAGVTGIHSQIYQFKAKGEEAFLPSSNTRTIALFTFQQLSLNEKNALRFGGRIEDYLIEKESSAAFGASDEKGFTGLNGSLGHYYEFSKGRTLESSVSFTQRVPTFQELYSDGEHVATGTVEVGDSTLGKEKSTSFDITFKNVSSKNTFTGSIYTQFFNDYIALLPTGTVNGDGVPVHNYEQIDALFYGLDLDNRSEVVTLDKGSLHLITKFDFVRAKNTDGGSNLARISPPRFSLGLEYMKDKWSADILSQYVAHQTKTAPNESSTDDYILTHLGYTYHLVGNLTSFDFFARVRNIFDVEARSHVSPLKEVAPLPGRNFIIGAQFQI